MAFGKISQALAIPAESTNTYTFYRFMLCPAGPPTLTVSHAGDGTQAFRRAIWHAANVARARRAGNMGSITEDKVKQLLHEEARLIADHCARSWANVYEDGEKLPAPCTPDKVYEFLCTVIDSPEGIAEYRDFASWAKDADNFRLQAADSADLGKA